jgi:N12 class adenine-specific DNA methylase
MGEKLLEEYRKIKAANDANTGSFARNVNTAGSQVTAPTWADQEPDPTYDDPEEQAIMLSRKRDPTRRLMDDWYRIKAEGEIRDLRERKSAAIGQKNLEARNPFMRGLYRGFDNLQGTYQGGLGMLSSLAGDETSAQQRFQAYKDEMRQASENPRDNIDFFSTDPKTGAFGSFSNFGTYAAGTLGEAVPSLAESVLTGIAGAALGAAVVPAPDPLDVATVPIGAVGGILGKGAIKKAISNAAAEYVKQGVATESAEQLARQYVGREVAKRFGSAAATTAVTGLHEGGGMYMEGREAGYDSPGTAAALGLASGLSESLLGAAPGVLKSFAGRSGVDEIARREGWKAAAGYLWDTAKASGEEGVQEGFQEFLGSLNKEINDPKSDLFNKENFMQWAEAAAGGALVGGAVKSGTTGVELARLRGGRGGRRGADSSTDPFIPQLPPGADTSEDPSNVQAKRELLERVVDEVNAGQRETFPRELAKDMGLIGPKEKSTSDSRLQRAEAEIARLRELENNLLAPPAQESTAQPPAEQIPPVAPPSSDAFEETPAPEPNAQQQPPVDPFNEEALINDEEVARQAAIEMERMRSATSQPAVPPSDQQLPAAQPEVVPPSTDPFPPAPEQVVPPAAQQPPVSQPEGMPPSTNPFDVPLRQAPQEAQVQQPQPQTAISDYNVQPTETEVANPFEVVAATPLPAKKISYRKQQTPPQSSDPFPVQNPIEPTPVDAVSAPTPSFQPEVSEKLKEAIRTWKGSPSNLKRYLKVFLEGGNVEGGNVKEGVELARAFVDGVAERSKAAPTLYRGDNKDPSKNDSPYLGWTSDKKQAEKWAKEYGGTVYTKEGAVGLEVKSLGLFDADESEWIVPNGSQKISESPDAVSGDRQREEVQDARGTRKGGGPNVEVETEGGQRQANAEAETQGQVSPKKKEDQAAGETPSSGSSIRRAIEENGGHDRNSADDVEAIRRKLYDGPNTPTHADIRAVMQDMKNEAGQKPAQENLSEDKKPSDQEELDKAALDALDAILADETQSKQKEPKKRAAPKSDPVTDPVEIDFSELKKGLNAAGVSRTIRATDGKEVLLLEESKRGSMWSIRKLKKGSPDIVVDIRDLRSAKEAARRIFAGTFDEFEESRFYKNDAKGFVGLSNDQLVKRWPVARQDAFASTLKSIGLYTDGRILFKASEKDKVSLLNKFGKEPEGRVLNVAAILDGRKAVVKDPGKEAVEFAYRGGDLAERQVLLKNKDGGFSLLDKVLHDTIMKKHPDAKIWIDSSDGDLASDPVAYTVDGEIVGVAMGFAVKVDQDPFLPKVLNGKYQFPDGESPKSNQPVKIGRKPRKSETTLKEAKSDLDAAHEALKRLKAKIDSRLTTGVDPELMADVVQVAYLYTKANIKTFKGYVEAVIEKFGETFARDVAPYMEAGWRAMNARGVVSDPAGKVEDYLVKGSENETDQSGDGVDGDSPVADGAGEYEGDGTAAGDSADGGGDAEGNPGQEGGGILSGGRKASKRNGRGGRARSGSDGNTDSGESEQGPAEAADSEPGSDDGAVEDRLAVNHVIGEDDNLAVSSLTESLRRNIKALEILKALESEGRFPDESERKQLAQYTGWGGLSQALDSIKGERMVNGNEWNRDEAWEKKWGDAYNKIKDLLTKEEFQAAQESTENAHYTSKPIIQSLWKIAERLGYNGGRVLELGAGVGHFAGLVPSRVRGVTQFVMVERDSVSSRIAKMLYPRHEVVAGDMEEFRAVPGSVTIGIGNVPFAGGTVNDSVRRYNEPLNLHNYSIARHLDAVAPGGVVVVISTHNTLDSSIKQRQFLATKGEFIGAIRLPNDAFAENAKTEVVTDILIFRRPRQGDPSIGVRFDQNADVIVKNKEGENITKSINKYFVDNPEMVLGMHSAKGSMYQADEYTVESTPGSLQDKLESAIERLPLNVLGKVDVAESVVASSTSVPFGRLEVRNGKVVMGFGDEFVPIEGRKFDGFPVHLTGKTGLSRAKDFIQVRDLLTDLRKVMLNESSSEDDVKKAQRKLNDSYDRYVSKHGPLNAQKTNIFVRDPDYYRVLALEKENSKYNPETKKVEVSYEKAAIFTQRVLGPQREPDRADSTADAMSISIAWRGSIDSAFVGKLLGVTPTEAESKLIEDGLAFRNPATTELEMSDLYLSGNVRAKLNQAEISAAEDPQYERNVEALKKVLPEDVTIKKDTVRLGATWVPESIINAFATEILGVKTRITYNANTDAWTVPSVMASESAKAKYATERINPHDVLSESLNLRSIKIYDKIGTGEYDAKGREKTTQVLNEKETQAAKHRASVMRADFEKWVLDNPEVTQVLARIYNDKYNNFVRTKYNGDFLVLPGSSPEVKLRPYQKDAIWRIINRGTSLLAHAVGSGKTYTMIGAAMEMRRLGLARRPLLVVQNATLGQFATSFQKMYPNANVLVATKDDLGKGKRQLFLNKISTGNWDAVVMAQSTFDNMASDPDVERAFIQDQLDLLEEAIREEGGESNKTPTVKQLVRSKKSLKNRFDNLIGGRAKKEDNITFEDLGADALFLDEAHAYKKPTFATKLSGLVGLNTESSARSLSTTIKVRSVQSSHNGRNVVLATGTPVTNTLGEAWHMVNYVSPATNAAFSSRTFDQFIANFAQVEPTLTMNAGGQYVYKDAIVKFRNGQQLVEYINDSWDIVTPDALRSYMTSSDTGLPELRDGKLTAITVDRTPGVEAFMDFISRLYSRYKSLTAKQRREMSFIPALAYGAAKAATLDIRLVVPNASEEKGSKLQKAADEIKRIYDETSASKGTQLFFSDTKNPFSMNRLEQFMGGLQIDAFEEENVDVDPDAEVVEDDNESGSFLYQELKKKLLRSGIPAEQIAFISDAKTDKQRQALFERVNSGDIRILIGSTAKMGVGVNVQKKLVALHHFDTPWLPADLEQREGRILRFGNENKVVEILRYAMKKTLDGAIYMGTSRKQKFIWQVLNGQIEGDSFDDPSSASMLSIEEQLAAIQDDPLFFEKIGLQNRLRELELERQSFYDTQQRIAGSLSSDKWSLQRIVETHIPMWEKRVAMLKDIKDRGLIDKFSFEHKEKSLDDPKKAADVIKKEVEKAEKFVLANFDDLKTIDRAGGVLRLSPEQIIRFKIGPFDVVIGIEPAFASGDGETRSVARTKSFAYIDEPNGQRYDFYSGTATVPLTFFEKIQTLLDETVPNIKAETDRAQRYRERIAELEGLSGKTWEDQAEYDEKKARLAEIEAQMLASSGSLTSGKTEDEKPLTDEEKDVSDRLDDINDTLLQTAPDTINREMLLQATQLAFAAEQAGIDVYDRLVAFAVKKLGVDRTRAIGAYLYHAGKAAGMKGVRPTRDVLGFKGVTREQIRAFAKAAFPYPILTDEQIEAGLDIIERTGLGFDRVGFAPFGSPVPGQALMQQERIQVNQHLESDQAKSYRELQPDEVPEKTRIAYKLMKRYKSKPGELFPLFVSASEGGFSKGKWYAAEVKQPKIGSKNLAVRPGIHSVDLPIFAQGKPSAKGQDRVWVEIEIPELNPNTQAESDSSPLLPNGMRSGITGRLIGTKEAYDYKTNPNAAGANAWPIAGSMKIVRVLSDEDVRKVLKSAGKDEWIDGSLSGEGVIEAEKWNALFQNQEQAGNVKGWTTFISATRAIIGATNKADFSTFIHEIFHPMRRFLLIRGVDPSLRNGITDEEVIALEKYSGVTYEVDKDGVARPVWDVKAEERADKAWEQYWFEGKAPPNSNLESLFQKIAQWMQKIYKSVWEITGGEPLPDDVRKLFDKLVQRGGGVPPGRTDTASPGRSRKEPLTSVKNAVAEELAVNRGAVHMWDAATETQQEWLDDAEGMLRSDPYIGQRLVRELNEPNGSRNLNNIEVAILQIYYRHVYNQFEAASDRMFAAGDRGDIVEKARLRVQVDAIEQELWNIEEAAKAAGREWGRAGVARQIVLRKDFSRAALLRRARVANAGNPLNEQQKEEIEKLARQVADLEGKLAKSEQEKMDLERQLRADKDINEEEKRASETPRRPDSRKRASSVLQGFAKKFANIFGIKPSDTDTLQQTEEERMAAEAESVVQAYVEDGVFSFGEFLAKIKQDLGSDLPMQAQVAFASAWQKIKAQGNIPSPTVDANNATSLTRIARRIQRALVESGITDRDEVVDAVQESFREMEIELTKRETMDALSGYGQFTPLSDNATDKIIRDINGQLQQVAKLQDMGYELIGDEWVKVRDGVAPSKTGGERRTPTDEERELIREVNEAKRRGGYKVTDPGSQLRTAVDAAKRAAANRIFDLKKAINEKKPIVANKTSLAGQDSDLDNLRKELAEWTEKYRDMFPKPEATMEQRIAATNRVLDAEIAAVRRQLLSGDVLPKGRKEPVSTPEIEAKRARLEALRAQREQLQLMLDPNMKDKLAAKAYMAALLKQIADYQDRKARNDFDPKPKKSARILTNEELVLKRQLEQVKDDFFRKAADYRLANMSPVEKAWDYTKETSHLSRALMTSFDLSAVFRQGGVASFSHPKLAAMVGRDMIKALRSEQANFDIAEKIRNHPLYQFAMTAKLAITEDEQRITKQEEAFMGRWVRWGIGKEGSTINKWSKKALSPVAASGRAYTTYLNGMRFELFRQMVDGLGGMGKVTADEAKVIATFVNVATGRADLGKFNQAAANMSVIFFAPRYVASRFQYLAMPFYLLPNSKISGRVRKVIAMEYARYLGSVSLFLGSVVVFGNLLAGDDDDWIQVDLDPRSSDFLKIRIGETRIDPMAGFSQIATFTTQALYGQRKRQDGEIRDLRGENHKPLDKDTWDVVSDFVRKKLAPIPGAFVDLIAKENVIGEKETPLSVATGLFVPLSWGEVKESMQSRGVPAGTAISVLALLGMGGGTYGPKTKYANSTNEEKKKLFEKDLEAIEYNTPDFGYKDLLTDKQLKQMFDARESKKQSVVYESLANPQRKTHKSDESFQKSVAERDKAIEKFRTMGLDFNDARLMLLDYYKRQYGSAYEMRGNNYVLRESYVQRLRQLRKVLEQK